MEASDSYKKEHDIDGNAISIPTSALKFISDISDKVICKIKQNENGIGTGFFSAIPFPDKYNRLPVLITNNHVLKGEDIIDGKTIKFSINNEKLKHEIKIDEERKRYTSEKYDITFIEIKKDIDNLNMNSFLDIDEDIFEENYKSILNKKSVYLLHYPHGNLSEYSSGIIKGFINNDDSFTFKHNCQTQAGSLGSPIINLINHKVIGIHKGYKEKSNFNLGTLLKDPINDFYLKREENFEDINNSTIKQDSVDLGSAPQEEISLFNIISFDFFDDYELNEEINCNLNENEDFEEMNNILFDILFNIYIKQRKFKADFSGSFLEGFNFYIKYLNNIFNFIFQYLIEIRELVKGNRNHESYKRMPSKFYEYDERKLREIKRKLSDIKIDRDKFHKNNKLNIYFNYKGLISLDFKFIYKQLNLKIIDIKRAIRYSNYKLISIEEINDIEYNINLINSSFPTKNIYLLNEFYNSFMKFLLKERKMKERKMKERKMKERKDEEEEIFNNLIVNYKIKDYDIENEENILKSL